MIADIFSAIGDSITAFTTNLSSAMSGITSIFYTSGTNPGLTPIGILILVTAGVALVVFAFNFVYRLINKA